MPQYLSRPCLKVEVRREWPNREPVSVIYKENAADSERRRVGAQMARQHVCGGLRRQHTCYSLHSQFPS
jgi:hypothetical protein